LRSIDEEENVTGDANGGHIIYMLRNLVNYYIDWKTSTLKTKDLDRGLYSLQTSSTWVDFSTVDPVKQFTYHTKDELFLGLYRELMKSHSNI
jgi:hypothetical protein